MDKQIIVEVVDAPMSTGKTSGIIEWMLNNHTEKYLYVSPMLSEVEERIPQSCESLSFVNPVADSKTTKGDSLLSLLKEGRNISFTHKLFQSLSKEHLDVINKQQYILIIDEEVGLIEPYSRGYSKGDVQFLLDGSHISIDYENMGEITWIGGDVDISAAYSSFKMMCDSRSLYITKGSREMLISQLPIHLVDSSKRTIILTYMFEGSVMESFLNLHNVQIEPFKDITLMRDPIDVLKRAKQLITFHDTPSTKKVSGWNMSVNWYSKTATKKQLQAMQSAFYSVYRKYDKERILLTLPKENSVKRLNGRINRRMAIGYKIDFDKVFLYSAARATNDYAERDVLIHAYNRYISVPVKVFFEDYAKDIEPDEDNYALAEMLQWIWRSAIRNDYPIKLYILNNRMKKLLQEWVDSLPE